MNETLHNNQPHDIAYVVEPRVDAATGEENDARNKVVANLTMVGVGGNILLAVFKFVAGILGNSMALVSDAVHSTSDVLATAVAYVGDRIARREADESHPYGHERFEQLAAAVLSLILAGVGIGIGYAGVESLLAGGAGRETPGMLALIAAAVSIVVKEGMFRYTMYYAKKLDSAAFKADAWHHRSDALSSVGSFIGVGMARLGYPMMDPIAGLLICALISEIPWALLHDGFHLLSHNVIFTLFWGFLGLCAIERYADDKRKAGIILVAMLCIAFVFRADYSGSGFAFIILYYALRRHRALQALMGCCILPMKWIAGLAFIPINMYNGQRGFIQGQVAKYLFYAFYPVHLFVIWCSCN